MATYLHQDPDGRVVEYRRRPYDPDVLRFELRALRPDGRPHDDRWYPGSDARMQWLDHNARHVLDAMWAEGARGA